MIEKGLYDCRIDCYGGKNESINLGYWEKI